MIGAIESEVDFGRATIEQVAGVQWDVIILGAGVAGASTAYWAASLGLKVLLVEAKTFPRDKVCGGCLNERAQASLDRLGILDDLHRAGAIPLNQLHIQSFRLGVLWRIPSLLSVRRSTLDNLLVQQAVAAGCVFLPNTVGVVESMVGSDAFPVRVCLKQSRSEGNLVYGRAVVVATGLTRSAVGALTEGALGGRGSERGESGEVSISPSVIEHDSRIGVHRLFSRDEWISCLPADSLNSLALGGFLHMLTGTNGYVGICVTDGGYVDVAAAIDPKVVRGKEGIPEIIREILLECGLKVMESFLQTQWQTTPALTRVSPKVALERLFLVGDALGYVEPFTGEGMAWGFENAEALAPILKDSICTGEFSQGVIRWEQHVFRQRATRQQVCKWVARQARWSWKSQCVLRFLDWFPSLRNRILKKAIA